MTDDPEPESLGRAGEWVRDRARNVELHAPTWIVELVKPRSAATPWLAMIRVPVSVVTPLGVGMALGQLPIGVLATIGSLPTALADRGGPLRTRTARMVLVALAAAGGLASGRLIFGHGWVIVPAMAIIAAVSALISTVGAILSLAALQLLVNFSVGSGVPFPVTDKQLITALAVGASFAYLLSVLEWAAGGVRSPERAAVADVYRNIAGLIAASGKPWVMQSRQSLTDALNTAYDTLLGARSRAAGRNREYLRLAGLLNAATPMVEAAVAFASSGRQAAPDVRQTIVAIGTSVAGGDKLPPMPEWARTAAQADPRERVTPERRAVARAVGGVLDRGDDPAAADGEATGAADAVVGIGHVPWSDRPRPAVQPPSLRQRLVHGLDQVITGRDTWTFVLRLVLCMSAAATVANAVPLQRSYWVLLTTAIVMKPDFGSVFARAVQRGLGTAIGAVIGSLILQFVTPGPLILPFIALFAALVPMAMVRNYGMFATFLTPVVVLFIDLESHLGDTLIYVRFVDTLLGCGVALIIGYLLWPGTWRVQLGSRVAGAVDLVADYVAEGFGSDPGVRGHYRRRAYRGLSDLRTMFQQTLAEPPPNSVRAAAWWPMIAQLEAIADSTTQAVISGENGGPRPAGGSAEACAHPLRELAAALRAGRDPGPVDLPDDKALDRLTGEIDSARRIAAGPNDAARGARALQRT